MSSKHYVITIERTEAADVLQVCVLQRNWVFIIMMKRF